MGTGQFLTVANVMNLSEKILNFADSLRDIAGFAPVATSPITVLQEMVLVALQLVQMPLQSTTVLVRILIETP